MLSGFTGVTIDGADLSQFGAKLLTKYSITSATINPTIFRTRNGTSIWRMGYDADLLQFDFPVDIYGRDKQDASEKLADLTAALSGIRYAKSVEFLTPLYSTGRGFVDIDISDGFIYHVTLSSSGAVEWANDTMCSVTYTLTGLRRKAIQSVSGLSSGEIFKTYGSYPRIDCDIDIVLPGDYISSICTGTDRWIQVNLYSATRNQDDQLIVVGPKKKMDPYWTCSYKLSSGMETGRIFSFSGTEKTFSFTDDYADPVTPGIYEIEWSDFPYLNPLPGAAVELKVSTGADPDGWKTISSTAGEIIHVQYYPVFL